MMNITQDTSFQSVGEQEIDFAVAQLVASSEPFRRWFVSQANPAIVLDEYIGGVLHASYAGEGESDLEFGFLTATGERHLVLVENKIDAAKQPNQIERYHNRGKFRIEGGEWDSFTVCLLAPERYVSEEDATGFDAIIHYEDVLEQLGELSYDGAEYLQAVFEAALTRSRTTTTADATDTLRAVEERVQQETGIPHLERDPEVTGYNKRTSFKSTHPAHHDAIRYDVYVGDTGEAGHTNVRLQIKNSDDLTEEERAWLKSIASRHQETLPDYTWHFDRTVNIGSKTLGHEAVTQEGAHETYVDAIADELLTLTNTFHPLFVGESS